MFDIEFVMRSEGLKRSIVDGDFCGDAGKMLEELRPT